MWVKPTEDESRAVVCDPRTHAAIPTSGIEVPDDDPYWVRLAAHGDVLVMDAAPKAEPQDVQLPEWMRAADKPSDNKTATKPAPGAPADKS